MKLKSKIMLAWPPQNFLTQYSVRIMTAKARQLLKICGEYYTIFKTAAKFLRFSKIKAGRIDNHLS